MRLYFFSFLNRNFNTTYILQKIWYSRLSKIFLMSWILSIKNGIISLWISFSVTWGKLRSAETQRGDKESSSYPGCKCTFCWMSSLRKLRFIHLVGSKRAASPSQLWLTNNGLQMAGTCRMVQQIQWSTSWRHCRFVSWSMKHCHISYSMLIKI